MDLWEPAYVGVGSNLEDPRAQVLRAFDELARISSTRVELRSRLYGSMPMGPADQPDFVNAVAGLVTRLSADELLAKLRAIELGFGRPPRHEKWGPRIIDLDLLVFGREQRATPQLTLPHPGVVDRNFVLYPLADIAPDLEVPGLGRVVELKSRVTSKGLRTL